MLINVRKIARRGNTTEKENIMGINILIKRQWFQIEQQKLVEVRSRDEKVVVTEDDKKKTASQKKLKKSC